MKRKLKIKKEIDYGIKTFIKDLNKHGYQTLYSCAGHKDTLDYKGKVKPDKEGYVSIKGNHDAKLIKRIADKYVKGISIKSGRMIDLSGKQKTFAATRISFKPKNLQRWGGD